MTTYVTTHSPSALPKMSFYFSRSKGTQTEGKERTITLSARLSVEIASVENVHDHKTVWVDIVTLTGAQITTKVEKMPDSIRRYEITEELFMELYMLSQSSPAELFYLTPLS